jgi:hypothetical protein
MVIVADCNSYKDVSCIDTTPIPAIAASEDGTNVTER